MNGSIAPTGTGLGSSALRHFNTSTALRTILSLDGPATLAQLTAATALSRRTVESILEELINAEWVEELEPLPTGSAGRPFRRFAARPRNALIAALRIDTFSVTAIVGDVVGRELGRTVRVLPDYFDPADSLVVAGDVLIETARGIGAPLDRIRGGGLATGGAVEDESVIRHIVHAPQWSGVDAGAILRERFGFPWFVDNDANLAALAEHWSGVATEQESFVWLITGNRTGAGILIHGEIHHGFRGSAGEIVEMSSIDLESYADQPIAWLTSPRTEQREHALSRLAAARAGAGDALAEVDEFVTAITPLVVTVSWTIAPLLIVLGGGLEDGADLVLPRLAAAMREAGAPEIPLAATSLGRDAPLSGALKLALARLDAELFGPTVLPARQSHAAPAAPPRRRPA